RHRVGVARRLANMPERFSRVSSRWRAVLGGLLLVLLADPGAGRLAAWPAGPNERSALAAPAAQQPGRQDVLPILECVIGDRPQDLTSVWGYQNPNSFPVTI